MSMQLRRWQGIGLSAFVLALMSLAAVPAFGQAENRQPGPEARLMAPSSSQSLPLGFAEKSFPEAMVGVVYNASVEAVGGSGAYALGVDGDLPPGLMAEAGAGTLNLRGIPTEVGSYKFEVFIRDLNGTSYTQEFEVRVAAQVPGALATRGPIVVDTEAFHFADADNVFFPIVLNVKESFNFADVPAEQKAIQIAVVEGFHFADQPSTTESVFVVDNEKLQITDAVSSAESVFIVDAEALHISDSDTGLDSEMVNDGEKITVTDTVSIAFLRQSKITWAQPAAIAYGTGLSATQLNAVASAPGTFVYTPALGTVLPAGTNVLSVQFLPTDPSTFAPATAAVNLVVNPVKLNIVASSPAVKYGAAVPVVTAGFTGLKNGDTAASFTVPPSCTTVYTPASVVGSLPATSCSGAVDTNYTISYVAGAVTITQATPVITWATPTAIKYGTALSATQLNATTPVAGTFVYSPDFGTVPTVGSYVLSTTFTPTDTLDYTSATKTVTLTVGKATPVLTWATPAPIVYGTALSATQLNATSPTAGTFTYTPASGLVPSAGARTLSVTLTPTDTVNYAPATTTVPLTVTQAPLVVSAVNRSSNYGSALPTLPYAVSGLVNGDLQVHALTGSPVLSTTAVAGSPAGTYPIAISQGTLTAANYSLTFVSGTLTINKAPLTVTAKSYSVVYGVSALPALTYSYSGFVNGDTVATATTGTPTISTTATAKSHAGSYPITLVAGTQLAPNYAVTYVSGTLTVSPAVLLVTPSPRSKVYGAALPSLPYTMTGFVNGELQVHVVTGAPAMSTTALASSPVGEYAITAAIGTLAATNYTFTFGTGTLMVTPATLNVTAQNKNVVYNQPIPALTFATTGYVNGDTSAILTGAPVLSTAAVVGNVPGSYPITITAGTLAAPNYSLNLVNGTLTILTLGTAATPTFSPVGGSYTTAQNVTLKCATKGAVIYFTLDGTVPTTASAVYAAPIPVSATTTINAIAVVPYYKNSAVGTATFTITP